MVFKDSIIIILFIFGLVFFGYQPDNLYVPFVLKAGSSEFFKNDIYVNQELFTFFFSIFGFITKFVSLEILFFILNIFCTFFNAIAVFNIAFLISKNKFSSYLALFLMLGGQFGMSACWISVNGGGLNPTTFVRPILLFSIYFFMKNNFRLSFLLLGLAFNIQAMESILVLTMFIIYFLVNLNSISKRAIFESFVLLILAALPIVIKVIFTTNFIEISSADMLKQWLLIVRARSWYHFFPFSWGISDWFIFSAWIIWLIYLRAKFDKTTNIFFSSILLLCVIGTVFVEIFPIPAVIKLHLWRSTIYFILFLIVYISDYLVKSYDSKNTILCLIIAGSISSIFLGIPKLILPFLLFYISYDNKSKKFILIPLLIIGLIGLLVYTFGSILNIERPIHADLFYKILSNTNLSLNNFIFFIIFLVILFLFLRIIRFSHIKFLLILFLLCICNNYVKYNTKTAFEKDWIDVCKFAKNNMSIDSCFITPIYLNRFRTYSQRSTFVEWQDGGFALLYLPYTIEWYERIGIFGYEKWYVNPDSGYDLREKYFDCSTEKFVLLAKKIKAKYIITENKQTLELQKLYKNNHFCIYACN